MEKYILISLFLFRKEGKTLTKKLAISKLTRRKIAVDESRIIYGNIKNQVVTVSSEYLAEKPLYFNM